MTCKSQVVRNSSVRLTICSVGPIRQRRRSTVNPFQRFPSPGPVSKQIPSTLFLVIITAMLATTNNNGASSGWTGLPLRRGRFEHLLGHSAALFSLEGPQQAEKKVQTGRPNNSNGIKMSSGNAGAHRFVTPGPPQTPLVSTIAAYAWKPSRRNFSCTPRSIDSISRNLLVICYSQPFDGHDGRDKHTQAPAGPLVLPGFGLVRSSDTPRRAKDEGTRARTGVGQPLVDCLLV